MFKKQTLGELFSTKELEMIDRESFSYLERSNIRDGRKVQGARGSISYLNGKPIESLYKLSHFVDERQERAYRLGRNEEFMDLEGTKRLINEAIRASEKQPGIIKMITDYVTGTY